MKNNHIKYIVLWVVMLPLLVWGNTPISKPQKIVMINNITNQNSQTDIALCIAFNEDYSAYDKKKVKPYITMTPQVDFSIAFSYKEICFGGLRPQTEYTVEVNKNLVLGDVVLDKSYTFTKKTTDYKPSLSFKDNGYILSSTGEISIPIETRNVDKLLISLYRINTENLMGQINEHGLIDTLSSYELQEIKENDGYLLWDKRFSIPSDKNHEKVTAINVGKFLKHRESGIYILAASLIDTSGDVDKYSVTTQWFMISDIGLFTLEGSDGLHVYTKHLSSAKHYENVKLELIANNNERLGTAIVKEGVATFAKKLLRGKRGLRPKAIYAYGEGGDFTVLDLSRNAFDLSDRGVNGRKKVDDYDAFMYSNRDIFRPGEQIKFDAIVRMPLGKAAANLKLSAKLFDARGEEISTQLLSTDTLGHVAGRFEMVESAPTGKWHIALYAGKEKAIGELSVLIEDFIPSKIALNIVKKPSYLVRNKATNVEVQTRYLTGEIFPHASVEVNTILHKVKSPYKAYNAYHFGKVDDHFYNQIMGVTHVKSGKEGNVSIPLLIKDRMGTSLPIAAHMTISANELGGRPVSKVLDVVYFDKTAYIGIKPAFKDDAINRNTKPHFQVVYLKEGNLTHHTLSYTLIQEEVDWNWKSTDDGSWEYYESYSDTKELDKGTLDIDVNKSTPLVLAGLDWGSYRLEIRDTEGIVSSYRFSSGYEAHSSGASPDKLPVLIDKKSYHPKDTVLVNIKAKFTGPLLVQVANHHILESKEIEAKEGEAVTVAFPVSKAWGSSAYILATSFRAQNKKLGATRAIGLAHVNIKDSSKHIDISLEYPKQIHASSPLTVMLESNASKNSQTYVTLAAVDEGILQMTGYTSPNPVAYFYGQRKLGIEIKDVYGNLIKPTGEHGEFEVGAGGDSEPMVPDDNVVSNKRKVVSLLQDSIAFDSQGKATVTFDIPDFQGALRLMAVAWSANAVGQQEGKVIVKDPISSELYMPSFISVGDKAEIILQSRFDTSVEDGIYQFNVKTTGGITLSTSDFNYTLEANQSRQMIKKLQLSASTNEEGSISLEILHHGTSVVTRKWQIGVREQFPKTYVKKIQRLDKGKSFDPKEINVSAWSEIHNVDLRFSSTPLLPVASLSKELIAYTGRCAEQTTSRAFPWIESKKEADQQRIKQAIYRLTNMQKMNGSFGLWVSSESDKWITAYVLDFLTTAQSKGYEVADKNIKQGLKWLERHLNRWSKKIEEKDADAYALYVLARANIILHSEILYHFNDNTSTSLSAQGWGYLAATLWRLGEKKKAQQAFEKATQALGKHLDFYSNYGGTLRNKANIIPLMKVSGMADQSAVLFADLALDSKDKKYFSTQEMSSILLASQAMGEKNSILKLRIDSNTSEYNQTFEISKESISNLPVVQNEGNESIWQSLSFVATPNALHYTPADNRGFRIEKHFYDLKGNELNSSHIEQNSRVVVVIKGEIQSRSIRHPLIRDYLVAGLELENPILSGIDASDHLKWLGKKTISLHSEYRNDRFETALRVDANNSFTVAYVARAVTIGEFSIPPTQIVDMYQATYRAFSVPQDTKMYITHNENSVVKPSVDTNSSSTSTTLDTHAYEKIYYSPVGDMKTFSVKQLYYLRNGIFAQAGYNFENERPHLHTMFSTFSWYHPQKHSKNSGIYTGLTMIQKNNVNALLEEEKKRCAGLVFSDFEKVYNDYLYLSDIKKYTEKDLDILAQSLLARHGLRFVDKQLTDIFSQMVWYHPSDITADEIVQKRFNAIEKENMKVIAKAASQLK